MFRFSTLSRISAQFAAIGLTGLLLGLSGCGSDGDDGATGPAGDPGPVGPPGSPVSGIIDYTDPSAVAALVAQGNRLVAEITTATIASPPVVTFTLATADGKAIAGFAASNTRYALAKLLPGSGNEFGGWQSYINRFETTDGTAPDALPQALQATTETGNAARFVDNGNGSYTYTFALDPASVTTPVAVAYEPNLTHRIAIQFGGIDNNIMPFNPSIDFVPSGGAGTGTRSIVAIETCNGCHGALGLHGGGRNNTTYCDTCHNDFSRDADTGALVDLAHMVHAIHAAEFRASQGEFPYQVAGFRETLHDYSEVTYPNDITDCASCHTASVATPDGDKWKTNISSEACGACHVGMLVTDAPDPVTGLSTYGMTHVLAGSTFVSRNDNCITCHFESGAGPMPEAAHAAIPGSNKLRQELGANYKAEIVGADFTVSPPTVDVKVTNLTSGADDLFADAEYTTGRQIVYLGWSTDDMYNGDEDGNVSFPGATEFQGFSYQVQLSTLAAAPPAQNADGSFTIPLVDLPAAVSGDPMISFDARMTVAGERAYAKSAVFFPGAARVLAVDEAKCNACHGTINNHGGRGNNNVLVCLNCHTSELSAGADSVALSVAVHKLHNADPTYLGGAVAGITFPGDVGKCDICHVTGRYNGPRETARAFTTVEGDNTIWSDDLATSPTAAICTNCHTSQDAINHMVSNGAWFDAVKSTFTQTGGLPGIPDFGQESCSVCHAAGRIADTAAMHR
ncbi:MAG: OmcA/MtrC family decaheme c-type cytochrome [Gammaproteobacteria bacterium]|nr:OmcA/MtrC family decaheme c-type cytochrome [Gammaproteobacteria bacterium]